MPNGVDVAAGAQLAHILLQHVEWRHRQEGLLSGAQRHYAVADTVEMQTQGNQQQKQPKNNQKLGISECCGMRIIVHPLPLPVSEVWPESAIFLHVAAYTEKRTLALACKWVGVWAVSVYSKARQCWIKAVFPRTIVPTACKTFERHGLPGTVLGKQFSTMYLTGLVQVTQNVISRLPRATSTARFHRCCQ